MSFYYDEQDEIDDETITAHDKSRGWLHVQKSPLIREMRKSSAHDERTQRLRPRHTELVRMMQGAV